MPEEWKSGSGINDDLVAELICARIQARLNAEPLDDPEKIIDEEFEKARAELDTALWG